MTGSSLCRRATRRTLTRLAAVGLISLLRVGDLSTRPVGWRRDADFSRIRCRWAERCLSLDGCYWQRERWDYGGRIEDCCAANREFVFSILLIPSTFPVFRSFFPFRSITIHSTAFDGVLRGGGRSPLLKLKTIKRGYHESASQEHSHRSSRRRKLLTRMWLCRCDCGVQKQVTHHNLTGGRSKKCQPCRSTRHGVSSTKLYGAWWNLKRGGKLPKEWQDFDDFRNAVGERQERPRRRLRGAP